MENASETQKEVDTSTLFIKVLAIVGFFASILLIVFIVGRGMQILPNAFNSLAGSFASIRNHTEPTEITVATGKNIVNSKESFAVSWTEFLVPGTYSFTYTCTDGVSLDVRSNNTITTVHCNEPITFPASTLTIDVIAASEKNRFTDVPFTIGFKAADGKVDLKKETHITVVNATIPQGGIATTEDVDTDTEEATPEPAPVPPTPSTPTAPVAPIPKPVTYFPSSDPNGFIDLEVTYLGIGHVQNGKLVPNSTLDADKQGVLRFMVRNVGTKTSDTFTYTIELPGNETYESSIELPLKPNERAVFTVSFDIPEKDSHDRIEVTVHTDSDTNRNNNSFDWLVEISE